MSKEEPAWKAELMSLLDEHFISSSEEIFDLVAPHILAAEQRGFQAGVNKTGDSVGKLREQLKPYQGIRNALALIIKFGDMSDQVRQELSELLESP